jgi:hypothetical protein
VEEYSSSLNMEAFYSSETLKKTYAGLYGFIPDTLFFILTLMRTVRLM